MVGRIYCIMILMTISVGFAISPAGAQSGRVFYIDYASGSNSNNGTQSSPWKTHPYMQTGSGCTETGSAPSYTHEAGDRFIFKGGVTWPAACFGMTISGSGTSISTVSGPWAAPVINGADYYGVDTTWYSGASFTRPIFDLANTTPTGTNGAVITTTGNFITLDDLEIERNMQAATKTGQCTSGTLNISGSSSIVLDRLYLHDWTIGDLANLDTSHDSGSICGANATSSQNIYNTEMSDAATTATLPFGTCFIWEHGEVAYNNCHDVGEGALFTQGTFHDNQIHDLDGSPVSLHTNPLIHSNGYESNGTPPVFYNNVMYNLNVDFNMLCQSSTTVMYNNVAWNSKVAPFEIDDNPAFCVFSNSSSQTFVYNNISDGATAAYGGSAHGSFRILNRAGATNGTVTFGNNISVNGSPQFDFVPQNQFTNLNMSSNEANTYGFTAANKYSPTSSDPNVVAKATNLQLSCAGALALCSDAKGAPWFGGSYDERPTDAAWDIGAYEFGGQSAASRPNPPSNLTATVQ